MAAEPATTATPEELSKVLVKQQYSMIEAHASYLGWDCRLEDYGDYLVLYVRIVKPGGRVFLIRIECDDYPRQAPQVRFIDPDGWDDADRQTHVDPSFHPRGSWIAADRGPLPVMCLRGHRDYYRKSWHTGWTNPPDHLDCLSQLVVNIRNAIHDHWN